MNKLKRVSDNYTCYLSSSNGASRALFTFAMLFFSLSLMTFCDKSHLQFSSPPPPPPWEPPRHGREVWGPNDLVSWTRGRPIPEGSTVRDETKWLLGLPTPMRGDGAPSLGSLHLRLRRTLPLHFPSVPGRHTRKMQLDGDWSPEGCCMPCPGLCSG